MNTISCPSIRRRFFNVPLSTIACLMCLSLISGCSLDIISPFERAILADDVDAVRHFLVDEHRDPNEPFTHNFSSRLLMDETKMLPIREQTPPLVLAARQGNLDMVQMLLDAGADVNAADTYGRTALYEASEDWWGGSAIGRLLLKHGADLAVHTDYFWISNSAVSHAVYSYNSELLIDLLDVAISQQEEINWDHLCEGAAREFTSQPTLYVLSAGRRAVRNGSPSGITLHVRNQIEADLQALREEGTAPATLHLFDTAEGQTFAWTPLMLAACNFGNTELVESQLNSGADPNETSDTGWAPLISAVYARNAQTIRVLTARGANPNITMRSRTETPLVMWAARLLPYDVVVALLEGGADPNAADAHGTRITDVIRFNRTGDGERIAELLKQYDTSEK